MTRPSRRSLATLAGLAGLAACGGGGTTPSDAAIDAPADVGDAGPCGADLFFTGEMVDFDSTDTTFCGIFGAGFTVAGDATRTDTTNPNGRFELCLPASASTVRVDITPPTGPSECTIPKSTYAVPGILIADKAVIEAGVMYSTRSFTVSRAPGFAYDPTKAQVFVHVEGIQRAISISGTGDAAQAWDGAAWAAGTTGINVFFPNVDPTPGTTTVSMAGGALGTGAVPIAAGTFTYVTIDGLATAAP